MRRNDDRATVQFHYLFLDRLFTVAKIQNLESIIL